MTTNGNEPRSVLDKATEAVLDVTEAVQTTTDSIAGVTVSRGLSRIVGDLVVCSISSPG